MIIGATIGFFLPMATFGPMIATGNTAALLFGFAGALITFVALVFSLLFLVVQYGNTAVSPRLTLFRDDPLVWHAFGFFVAIFTYTTVAALRIRDDQVPVMVPALAIVSVLAALVLSRTLQLRALRLMQFNSIMELVRRRGERLFASIYQQPVTSEPDPPLDLPGTPFPIVWTGATTILSQVDLSQLIAQAARHDAVIELVTMIGSEVRRGQVFAIVHGDQPMSESEVVGAFSTGIDRSFAQDPLLAFRLLADIGDRSLSAAINDPATAVQALGCTYDLLAMVADRNLDPGPVTDGAGHRRVLLPFPSWETFVSVGLDELITYSRDTPLIRARLVEALDDLCKIAPPDRHPPLLERRRLLTNLNPGLVGSAAETREWRETQGMG